MTLLVVWLCRRCIQPVTFTADITRLGPGDYRAESARHIHAHNRQHQ